MEERKEVVARKWARHRRPGFLCLGGAPDHHGLRRVEVFSFFSPLAAGEMLGLGGNVKTSRYYCCIIHTRKAPEFDTIISHSRGRPCVLAAHLGRKQVAAQAAQA